MGYEAEACIRGGSACSFGKTKGSNVRHFWYVVAAVLVFMLMMYGVGSCFGCEACFACGACVDENCDGACDMESCGRDCYEDGPVYSCKYDCSHDSVTLYYPGHESFTEEVTTDRKDFSSWIWKYEYNSTYFTFNGATDDTGKQFINSSGQRVKAFDKVSGKLTFNYTEKKKGMSYTIHFGQEDIYFPVSATVGAVYDEYPDGDRPTQDGKVCTGWATPSGTKVAYYDDYGQFKWSGSEFHLYNWSVSPDGESDIYLTPVYELVKFKVTFVGQNGVNVVAPEVGYETLVSNVIEMNENVQRLETELQYAKFLGWGLTANATESDKIDTYTYQVKGNVTFYIILEEHVELRFYLNNGTDACFTVQSIRVGSDYMLPTLATAFPEINEVDIKPGYTFRGWYYSPNANASTEQPLSGVITVKKQGSGNYVDFYGGYAGRTYELKYFYYVEALSRWTQVGSTVTYEYGKSLELEGEPQYNAGCTFVGWCDNEELTGACVTSFDAGTYGDKKMYAKYQANTFTLTLDKRLPNASLSTTSKVIAYGQDYQLPVPTSTGSEEFYGWEYNGKQLTDETGKSLQPFTFTSLGLSVGNAEAEETYRTLGLQAKWGVARLTVTYHIDYSTKTEKVYPNGTAQGIADPEKTGYTFDGWYTSNSYTSTYNFSTPVTTNIHLYAKFVANQYDVILDANGGVVKGSSQTTVRFTYETKYTGMTEYIPTRADHTFLGWYYVDGDTEVQYIDANGNGVRKYDIADNIRLIAMWERTTYHITYMVGNSAQTYDYTKGSNRTTYTNPTLPDAYAIFYGWYDSATGGTAIFSNTGTLLVSESELLAMADSNGNITLYAQW